jgi:general secretion pathway protein L
MTFALVPPLYRAEFPVQFHPAPADPAPGDAPLALLLPVTDCSVAWLEIDAATPRQAAAVARTQALANAIETDVHVVADPVTGPIPVATVSHQVMRHWLGWAAANGYRLDAVIPAAAALPEPAPGTVSVLTLAGEQIARTGSRAFALEPGLADVLTGGVPLVETDADAALAALAARPQLNLLTGPYAPPRASWFSGERLRAAAALVALILLVSLAMGVTRLIRVHADIARIDAAVSAQASEALNRDVSADAAMGELDARLAATGASRGSASATLAALMQAMEGQAAVGLDAASWDRAGTLTVTLGAPRAEDINPVLLALQNAGYRITAQPRQGSDGRALGDITIRSEP